MILLVEEILYCYSGHSEKSGSRISKCVWWCPRCGRVAMDVWRDKATWLIPDVTKKPDVEYLCNFEDRK